MKQETPGAGTPRALENVCLAADIFQIAPRPLEIQKNHLRHRFGLSPATAAALAELAFTTTDRWGRA